MFDETYGDDEKKGQHKDNDYCNKIQWPKENFSTRHQALNIDGWDTTRTGHKMTPHTCLVKFHINFVINGIWCSKCYCKYPTIWSPFCFCGWTTLILNSWSLQWNKVANTMLEDLLSVVYIESYTFITPKSHPIVVAIIHWSLSLH